MRSSYLSILWIALVGFLLSCFSISTYADDPGITKVRLIQQSDSSYLFEADVPQNILSSIRTPILPERFQFTNFDYTIQSGWITLQMSITTSGQPFNKDDEIILPWLRNGVDFTVQWKDGATYKGLFNRTLNGIHIPLKEVMPTIKTTGEVLKEAFFMGVNHLGFKLVHVILIIVLAWNFPSRKALKLFLWYALGQSASMIIVEFKIPEIDLLYSELLITLSIFLVSYAIVYRKKMEYAGIILLSCGIIHGLSFTHEIASKGLGTIQRIQSLFAFNLAIDIGHFMIGFIFILSIPFIKRFVQGEKKSAILSGSISVFLIFLIFLENIVGGQKRILDFGDKKTSINIPVTYRPSAGQVQRGTGLMTTPIMVYLSVEPYEVRLEILVKASEAIRYLRPEHPSPIIPIASQEQIKSLLSETILERSNIRIKNESLIAAEVNANFVRLSRGGVSIRETPVEENTDGSIIGITCIYDIESFPDSIHFDWQFFPDAVQSVEASIVDPHGALTSMLNQDNHTIKWGSRLSGFQLPTVEPIVIERYALPLVSMILWMGILLVMIYLYIRDKSFQFRWLILIGAIAFLMYPFIRVEAAVPFLPQWKPSEERTTVILNDLLSNVYRAFDRRKEGDVYDRLAMSVTGDQLTEIYLQNRQVMALENRGGARANVDEINILEVFDINHTKDDGFEVDAAWTVRGSVNHFGHTHYRKNQYRALVSFVNENEIWKINSIEAIDEKRIY